MKNLFCSHGDMPSTSSRKFIVYEECLLKRSKYCKECQLSRGKVGAHCCFPERTKADLGLFFLVSETKVRENVFLLGLLGRSGGWLNTLRVCLEFFFVLFFCFVGSVKIVFWEPPCMFGRKHRANIGRAFRSCAYFWTPPWLVDFVAYELPTVWDFDVFPRSVWFCPFWRRGFVNKPKVFGCFWVGESRLMRARLKFWAH